MSPTGQTPWKVVIADRISGTPDVEQRIFGSQAQVLALNAKRNEEVLGRIEDADAILAWHDLHWNEAMLSRLKKCKSIVRVGAGFDNVDLATAKKFGIIVSNVPDYGTHDVADHAMSLLLALARGLFPNNRKSTEGEKSWAWGLAPSFRLTGKKMGIIGLGRIGTAAAMRAKAFGMEVGFYDPYKPAGWDKALGLIKYFTLRELLAESDVLSFHTPLTPETKGMANREFFTHCKRGVVVINTARGPVMDWLAFKDAFQSGQISCAGFDVLPVEPIDLEDSMLRSWANGDSELRDRLLITPHCAFYSSEAFLEMREKAALESLRVLRGEKPQSQVN